MRLAGDIGERHFARRQALDRAADHIHASFTAYGYAPVFEAFEVGDPHWLTRLRTEAGLRSSIGRAPFRNIVATLPGTMEETIVIGAHYDTVAGTPGADDNASGVAVLLEAANLLRSAGLDRTVRFVAFANEEPPFFRTPDMGSARHVRASIRDGKKPALMICLEMVGFYSDAPRSQSYPPCLRLFYPNRGHFIAVAGNIPSRRLVRRIARTFRAKTRIPVEALVAPRFVPGLDFSDQLNFWKAGIPAVMVTDTAFYRNPHYHGPGDRPDTLRYDKMAEVTKGVCAAVRDLAAKGDVAFHVY